MARRPQPLGNRIYAAHNMRDTSRALFLDPCAHTTVNPTTASASAAGVSRSSSMSNRCGTARPESAATLPHLARFQVSGGLLHIGLKLNSGDAAHAGHNGKDVIGQGIDLAGG